MSNQFFRAWGCLKKTSVEAANKNFNYNPPEKTPPMIVPWKNRAKAEGNTKIPGTNTINPSALLECTFYFTLH